MTVAMTSTACVIAPSEGVSSVEGNGVERAVPLLSAAATVAFTCSLCGSTTQTGTKRPIQGSSIAYYAMLWRYNGFVAMCAGLLMLT